MERSSGMVLVSPVWSFSRLYARAVPFEGDSGGDQPDVRHDAAVRQSEDSKRVVWIEAVKVSRVVA